VVSEVSAVPVPLAPMLAHPLRALPEDERERYLKRAGAWLAVILVHALFIAGILTAGQLRQIVRQTPHEVIFILPPIETKVEHLPPVSVTPSVRLTPIPERLNTITLPPPPKEKTAPPTQSDVMQAIGKELACGAGSWEHLSQAQREACRRQPWRFKKNAKGVIVMDTSPPPTEEMTSGADQQLHIGQTADPCLAAGNTHSECVHKTLFGR
jgi:hypothetical protein